MLDKPRLVFSEWLENSVKLAKPKKIKVTLLLHARRKMVEGNFARLEFVFIICEKLNSIKIWKHLFAIAMRVAVTQLKFACECQNSCVLHITITTCGLISFFSLATYLHSWSLMLCLFILFLDYCFLFLIWKSPCLLFFSCSAVLSFFCLIVTLSPADQFGFVLHLIFSSNMLSACKICRKSCMKALETAWWQCI